MSIPKDKILKNDEIFKTNLEKIEELVNKNWIPSEIARVINMDRHAFLSRLRKTNLKINKRNSFTSEKKICCFCKEEKLLCEFTKKNPITNQFSSRCKKCRTFGFLSNLENYIYRQIKNNAKQRGLEFNLSKDDIQIPEYCPILNVKLDISYMSNKNRYFPSVDRIDSNKGYIKGNIMIVSMKANMMKNDATQEELLNFSNYFINKIN
jgi:hypothetical protein